MRLSPLALLVLILGVLGCGQASAPDATAARDSSTDAGAPPVISGRYPGLARGAEDAPAADYVASAQAPSHLHPVVTLQTSAGDITLRLNAEASPVTVGNFLQYVEEGHYKNVVFHQVVDGYMVLGGLQTADEHEKPARRAIRNEAHNGLSNLRGTIAMARQADDIDSATCQFFINLADNVHLNHQGRSAEEYGYCVFGEVIEGMDVVEKIGKTPVRDTQSNAPLETVLIKGALRR